MHLKFTISFEIVIQTRHPSFHTVFVFYSFFSKASLSFRLTSKTRVHDLDATNSTRVALHVPAPHCHGIPFLQGEHFITFLMVSINNRGRCFNGFGIFSVHFYIKSFVLVSGNMLVDKKTILIPQIQFIFI